MLFRSPWIAHRQNPVITSIKSARPAGSFIKIGDKLIRPSQNSGHTYGGSIMLNEIIELNENTYVEKINDTISSNDLKPSGAIGIHTISNFGNSTLIDGKFTGFKIGKIYF